MGVGGVGGGGDAYPTKDGGEVGTEDGDKVVLVVWRQGVIGELEDAGKELEDGAVKGLEVGLEDIEGEGTEEMVHLGRCEAVVEDLEEANDGASFVGMGNGGGAGDEVKNVVGVLKNVSKSLVDVFGGANRDATGRESGDSKDVLGGALLEEGVLFVLGDGGGDVDFALGGVKVLTGHSALLFKGGEGGNDILGQRQDKTVVVEGVDLGVGVLFTGSSDGDVVEGGVGDRAFGATLDNTTLLRDHHILAVVDVVGPGVEEVNNGGKFRVDVHGLEDVLAKGRVEGIFHVNAEDNKVGVGVEGSADDAGEGLSATSDADTQLV